MKFIFLLFFFYGRLINILKSDKRLRYYMRFALINKDDSSTEDILRIIPNIIEDKIHFKFSLLDNHFRIYFWQLDQNEPQQSILLTNNEEITYHSSIKDKKLDPVVHIKDNSSKEKYKTISENIIDMRLNSDFPIPLCKVSIKEKSQKIYTNKIKHAIFDFNDKECPNCNTVEIFIMPKEQDRDYFKKWPHFYLLWQISTMDYLINGPELSQAFLNTLENGPRVNVEVQSTFPEFDIVLKVYYDENITENSISFYENEDYKAMLATAKIQLVDDKTKKPITKIAPAFAFYLDWQFGNKMISRQKADDKRREFDKMQAKIDSLNIHRPVFCIPQVSI